MARTVLACFTKWGKKSLMKAKYMSEFEEILAKIKKFRDERDWMQFHNHKDMALSLVLEATEVLEHFQWKTPQQVEEYAKNNKDEIGEELADVAVYLFELADNLGIDIKEAINKKMEKNDRKYPVEKAKGRADKYTKL